MEIRFNHNFYVMNMDDDFDYDSFENKLIDKLKKYYYPKTFNEIFKIKKNETWDIEFDLTYNNVEDILVYKKNKMVKDEDYILYRIHIPVPKKGEIYWGIEEDNFISNIGKANIDYFNIVKRPDLNDFINLHLYLIECILLGIKNIFPVPTNFQN